jgi:hypothetical protein
MSATCNSTLLFNFPMNRSRKRRQLNRLNSPCNFNARVAVDFCRCFVYSLAFKHRKEHTHISRLSTTLSHVFCLSYRDYAETHKTDENALNYGANYIICGAKERLKKARRLTSLLEIGRSDSSHEVLRHSHISPSSDVLRTICRPNYSNLRKKKRKQT